MEPKEAGGEAPLSERLEQAQERHRRMGELLSRAWQVRKASERLPNDLVEEARALCRWAREEAARCDVDEHRLHGDSASFAAALRRKGDALLARQLLQAAIELESVLGGES